MIDIVDRLRAPAQDVVGAKQVISAARTAADEIERLRHALKMISIVDQGCGGTLTASEMARSAMEQARDAITSKEK